MKLFEYQCDDCGERRRRITVHKIDGEELHFCSTVCMDDFIDDDTDWGAALRYHITGQDIADGA